MLVSRHFEPNWPGDQLASVEAHNLAIIQRTRTEAKLVNMALLPPTGSAQALISTLISSATASSRGSKESSANLAAFLAVSSRMSLYEPEQLERLDILASGNTFKVHKCRDTESGKLVAVKTLLGISRRPISRQPKTIDYSVLQELKISSYPPFLKCKNITQTLGFEHDNLSTGTPIISLVVEYSEIGTLQQYLASTSGTSAATDWAQKRELAAGIASGIEAIHRCRVIHGDLKPDNILLFPNPSEGSKTEVLAKISDFGSSIIENTFEAEELSNELKVYRGTPLWVPPIVRKSLRVPFERMPLCDVFSFGLVAWTIYKGRTYYESSWKPPSLSDIQFLDNIGVLGLLERFRAYLIDAQDMLPIEAIQVLEQVVIVALTNGFLDKDHITNTFIHREKSLKIAFEEISNLKNILMREQAKDNQYWPLNLSFLEDVTNMFYYRVPPAATEHLWQPFHMTAHSFAVSIFTLLPLVLNTKS
jgi:serine/threonine protein kinase